MEAWIKVAAGFALLALSLSFLYRPGWILRLNALGRALLFNDSYVLLYRRRWGLLLFLGATMFFYSGFQNLHRTESSSTYLQLQDAYRTFRAQQYKGTIVRCQEILKRESDNAHAWALLGASWSALGRHDQARRARDEAMRRAPAGP